MTPDTHSFYASDIVMFREYASNRDRSYSYRTWSGDNRFYALSVRLYGCLLSYRRCNMGNEMTTEDKLLRM
ncbi:hypothetical protein DPMN_136753 [Dreissena polymorpha]|uniref:Uncharacterized protein n=1 Tax=Dreissena polymorpha TaxID=45954 RepID=A0A9D4JE33_DREPO|nr:hypothetical protein DPMN_136753 [Dreissena polymorpha]